MASGQCEAVSPTGHWPLTTDLCKWTAGESHPDFRRAKAASSCWTSSPSCSVAEVGVEPTIDHHPLKVAALPVCVLGCKPTDRCPWAWSCGSGIRTRVGRLMRPCWWPLQSIPQDSPQYSRQDSNLRCPPCERGAVAAGPREWVSIVSAGLEPAISTMSRWRALRLLHETVSRAGRSRTCLEPRIRRLPRRPVPGPL